MPFGRAHQRRLAIGDPLNTLKSTVEFPENALASIGACSFDPLRTSWTVARAEPQLDCSFIRTGWKRFAVRLKAEIRSLAADDVKGFITIPSISLAVPESKLESSRCDRSTAMPSPNYRYQCLDLGGRLHDTDWFYAESDSDALAFVEAKHPDSECVIWQDRRLVAKIGFDGIGEVITRSRCTAASSYSLLRETSRLLGDDHCFSEA